jgi:hypothetical protein
MASVRVLPQSCDPHGSFYSFEYTGDSKALFYEKTKYDDNEDFLHEVCGVIAKKSFPDRNGRFKEDDLHVVMKQIIEL